MDEKIIYIGITRFDRSKSKADCDTHHCGPDANDASYKISA